MGGGWDCTGWSAPQGDIDPETGPGHGVAFLLCNGTYGPWTSPVDAAPWPLAVVTFDVLADGTDTLTLRWVGVYGDHYGPGVVIVQCYDDLSLCYGASNDKTYIAPTPTLTPTPTPKETSTPTNTPTPTRTPGSTTPGPVGGIAEPPDIESGAATSGPGASVASAAAAMGAALLVAAGGWYARRRWRAD